MQEAWPSPKTLLIMTHDQAFCVVTFQPPTRRHPLSTTSHREGTPYPQPPTEKATPIHTLPPRSIPIDNLPPRRHPYPQPPTEKAPPIHKFPLRRHPLSTISHQEGIPYPQPPTEKAPPIHNLPLRRHPLSSTWGYTEQLCVFEPWAPQLCGFEP